MSYERCDDCGFIYENINFCPCPTCRLLSDNEKKQQSKEPTAKQTRRKIKKEKK